jgi:CubicO group peptidase (beta-lactamase class C family)
MPFTIQRAVQPLRHRLGQRLRLRAVAAQNGQVIAQKDLQSALLAACDSAGVVGASIAVASRSALITATTGVTSVADPREISPSTPFRMGSIAKIFTANLVVDVLREHNLSTDVPVAQLVPEFRLADRQHERITVAHLLTHTAGINGDPWDHSSGGPEAIAKYVASLGGVDTLFNPGAAWAYSNSGFVEAARVVERVTGRPFAEALQAAVRRWGVTEVELWLGAAPPGWANGHYQERTSLRKAREPEENTAFLPAGAGLWATARALARFCLMHLGDEPAVTPAAAEMRKPTVELPRWGGDEPTHQGLGWKIYVWPVGRLIGHNGNATGQVAFLRGDLDSHIAIACMTNTIPGGAVVWRRLSSQLWPTFGLVPNPRPAPLSQPAPVASTLAGTYEARGVSFVVTATADGLDCEMRILDNPPARFALAPCREDTFITSSGVAVVFEVSSPSTLLHYGPLTATRRRRS